LWAFTYEIVLGRESSSIHAHCCARVKLSEIIEGQKIEISLAWLSHILTALRIFLALLGNTLIVSGLAIRSMCNNRPAPEYV